MSQTTKLTLLIILGIILNILIWSMVLLPVATNATGQITNQAVMENLETPNLLKVAKTLTTNIDTSKIINNKTIKYLTTPKPNTMSQTTKLTITPRPSKFKETTIKSKGISDSDMLFIQQMIANQYHTFNGKMTESYLQLLADECGDFHTLRVVVAMASTDLHLRLVPFTNKANFWYAYDKENTDYDPSQEVMSKAICKFVKQGKYKTLINTDGVVDTKLSKEYYGGKWKPYCNTVLQFAFHNK